MNRVDTQQSGDVQRSSSGAPQQGTVQRAGAPSRKVQLLAGAQSFAEGEARLAPSGQPVQMDKAEGATDAAQAPATEGGADGKRAEEGKPEGAGAALDAAGRAALAALPAKGAAADGPGQVGQGEVEAGGGLPDWFMQLQDRLVQSTQWGAPEEAGQHALRDYAMYFAKQHAGPDGKVPGHIQAFFDYIGRGTLNDASATAGGYKGSSALGGAKKTKNWCAGAATAASKIAQKEGRAGVTRDLAARGLAPFGDLTLFFQNLAQLSGAGVAKTIYGEAAYTEHLLPGDRVDFLFQGCQYGGHAVHIVADLGDTFMHVSGNTTMYSAVATGAAKRLKSPPAGFNLTTATSIKSDAEKDAASKHIRSLTFAGSLVYSISRLSDPYTALSMLSTDDPKAQEDAIKKLRLKRTQPVAPTAAPDPAQAAEGG